MQEWINKLSKMALPALFYMHPHIQHSLNLLHNLAKARQLGVKVLHEYKQLMKNNREFVESFKETEKLFHPEFLKDLYNLVIQPWGSTAYVINTKIKAALHEHYPGQFDNYLESVRLQDEIVIPVENYRVGMINPHRINMIVNYTHPSPW